MKILEVLRHLDSVVVGECLIKELEDGVKGCLLLNVLEVKILHHFPSCSLKTANQVEAAFSSSFLELHLEVVDVDALSPFNIRLRLAIELGDVVVPQTSRVQTCRGLGGGHVGLGAKVCRPIGARVCRPDGAVCCGLWWFVV